MTWRQLKWYLVAAGLVFGPVGTRVFFWDRGRPVEVDQEMAKAGEGLFNHTWQIKDSLTPAGDGLGPVFNARSCVACHNQGGPGGGGDVDHNVTTYVIQRGTENPREGVLHSHATDESFRETLAILDPSLPATSQVPLQQLLAVDGTGAPTLRLPTHIRVSQRNTPALFGSNLIDSIPERVIVANERAQRLAHGKDTEPTRLSRLSMDEAVPVGRAHRLPDGRIGRFGWKAQTARLSDFVEAACANELGLGNPSKAQPVSIAMPGYQSPGIDLTQQQCDQLTAYVAALKQPEERIPVDTTSRKSAEFGKELFGRIGCADCHTPTLGSVEGIYSDLLLHRMGAELVAAGRGYYTEMVPAANPRPPSADSPETAPPAPDEWRTPPLWGVADSAPYMHDGRAATLEKAIEMHGGQAAAAAGRFSKLDPSRRAQLLAFLGTLRAP